MTDADEYLPLLVLLKPGADDGHPGWRPLPRAARSATQAQDTALPWDPWNGVLITEPWQVGTDAAAIIECALLATCDQCGGLGRVVTVEDDGCQGVRCSIHDPSRPVFGGLWEALDQAEGVVTPGGDTVRVEALPGAERAGITAWLHDDAPTPAGRARERALLDAHHAGDDEALRAAIDIPAHDLGLARAQVESSRLMAALTGRGAVEILVDLPDDLVAYVDAAVAAGKAASREEFILAALERYHGRDEEESSSE